MKHLNPFFTIGSIGMIVIAILHVLLAVLLARPAVHSTFFIIYPVFLTFLILGCAQMMRKGKVK